MIKRILESRSEWDPPWLRERRVRGPPRQTEIFTAEEHEFSPTEEHEFSQVVPEAEEEFSQLPPDGEDA